LSGVNSRALRALIVDDEPVARRVLRDGLEQISGGEVIGEAANGRQALDQIRELRPNLLLLDLEMPRMSGFEVVREMSRDAPPAVVIVTAYDQHAIEAFEAGAVDYLLKPVADARLAAAVERVRSLQPAEIVNQLAKINSVSAGSILSNTRKLVGRQGREYHFVDLDDVVALQADRELVWIITANQRYLATHSLRSIESRLEDPRFERVHRNAIVNLNHVRKMISLSSQRWRITLSNALEMVVSKRQAHRIRQILHW
jgi:DNA-binding LytR/AlgR family response regulator